LEVTDMDQTSKLDHGCSTLRAAHELLHRAWPGRDASVAAWLAYHRHAAALYDHVAESDPDHRHEARYWAQQARSNADAFAEQTSVSDTSHSACA
jgi:hypothetical protein